jgi:hypothetical protein
MMQALDICSTSRANMTTAARLPVGAITSKLEAASESVDAAVDTGDTSAGGRVSKYVEATSDTAIAALDELLQGLEDGGGSAESAAGKRRSRSTLSCAIVRTHMHGSVTIARTKSRKRE